MRFLRVYCRLLYCLVNKVGINHIIISIIEKNTNMLNLCDYNLTIQSKN